MFRLVLAMVIQHKYYIHTINIIYGFDRIFEILSPVSIEVKSCGELCSVVVFGMRTNEETKWFNKKETCKAPLKLVLYTFWLLESLCLWFP